MDDTAHLAQSVRDGNPRATARLISMIEREDPSRLAILKVLHALTGRAHIIGITGPPGSGKSTLTDKLVSELRASGRTVAVVAVDPSSPFTGGAILGDRIRMMRHATDDGVYIRSLATRGHLGGLSRATAETVRALDAAGYDDVIIETVGVGQSEVDVVRIADTVVLVSVPGLGDDIQAIKAGVMEIGDVFCVNKADRDGAERVVRETKSMLETAVMNGAATRFTPLYEALSRCTGGSSAAEGLNESSRSGNDASARANFDQGARANFDQGARANFDQGAMHHIARQSDGHGRLEIPAVLPTVAETGDGVRALLDAIKAHESALGLTGMLKQRRTANLAWELGNAAAERLLASLESDERKDDMAGLAASVIDKNMDFYDALSELESLIGSRKP